MIAAPVDRFVAGLLRWRMGMLAACLVLAALANSALGPPLILSDEYTYAAQSAGVHANAHASAKAAAPLDLPNRLFFAIYSVAHRFPSPFVVARALNVAALALGAFALLVAAERFRRPLVGLALVAAYVLGGEGTYSAYFMPEALYGATFIVAALALARALAGTSVAAAFVAGLSLACLTFIKPHAWAVVIVFVCYCGMYAWRSRREKDVRDVVRVIGCAGLTLVGGWLILDALLPDVSNRAQFLGKTYGMQVPGMLETALDISRYPAIAYLVLANLLAVGVVAMPALWFGVHSLFRIYVGRACARERDQQTLCSLGVLVLGALIVMVSVFTVSVAGSGSYEVSNRLHGRLYAFVVTIVVLAAAASGDAAECWRRHRIAIAASWLLICALAAFLLPDFVWYSDSAELYFGASAPKQTLAVFGLLGAILLIGSRRYPKAPVVALLLAYVGSTLATGSAVRYTQISAKDGPADRVGRAARVLADQTHLPIWIVGSPNALASVRIAAYAPLESRFVDPTELQSHRKEKAIVVGSRDDLAGTGVEPRVDFEPFLLATTGLDTAASALARRMTQEALFSTAGAGDGVARVSGIHAREHWGAWSAEPRIVVEFAHSLVGNTRVRFRAFAYGNNAGRQLRVQIGDQVRRFALSQQGTDIDVDVTLRSPANTLIIDGYEQLKPRSDGQSTDTRLLGIGVVFVRVTSDRVD
jgi:phosphoglycerol transferase